MCFSISSRHVSSSTRFSNTSSTTPYDLVIERSAICNVILIDKISSSPILLHMDKGIKLMLAPKSIRAFPIDIAPIEQGIVTLPGSLYFGGRILWITTLQFPSTTTILQYRNNLGQLRDTIQLSSNFNSLINQSKGFH